jgi:hypothetical protein
MLKKYAIFTAALLMSTMSLFAEDHEQTAKETNLYSGGFVTGVSLTTLQTPIWFGGNAGSMLQFGYYGACWMFDLGASYGNHSHFHSTFVMGHLGLRNRLYQNLFISYGAMGLGNINNSHPNEQWSAGAFTGLDYQFSRHLLLSAKVYPYNYDHRLGSLLNNVFANSTISLFYVF